MFFKIVFLAFPAIGLADSSFIWWKLNGQSRSPEGGVLLSLSLEVQGQPEIFSPEVIFRQTPLTKGSKRQLSDGGPFFRKSVSPFQRDFVFYLGQSAKLDIFAKAQIRSEWLYAQTVTSGNGKFGLTDPDSSPIKIKAMGPNWPQWTMVNDKIFLNAKTGSNFELEFSEVPSLVKVFDNQVVMANFPGEKNKKYSYSKQEDYELTHDLTRTLKKIVVFTAYLNQGGRASFSVPIFRASNYHIDYPQGIATMAATVIGVIGLVIASGARFEFR
jgi:hypothetical protein